MSTQTATLTLAGDMRFEGTVGSGHAIVLDSREGNSGARPSELVGLALGGCTAMDVISILRKKRQDVTSYEIRVSGLQVAQHPHNFTRFDVQHIVEGNDLDVEAVRRAIELSAAKYCSVGSTLSSGMLEVHHGYVIRTPGGEDITAEVLVTGPGTVPEELAASV